jgi:hypothetical protein
MDINETLPILQNFENLERAHVGNAALMEMRINQIIFQFGDCDYRVSTEIQHVRRNKTLLTKVQEMKICAFEVSVGFHSMHVQSMKQSPVF